MLNVVKFYLNFFYFFVDFWISFIFLLYYEIVCFDWFLVIWVCYYLFVIFGIEKNVFMVFGCVEYIVFRFYCVWGNELFWDCGIELNDMVGVKMYLMVFLLVLVLKISF